MSEPPTPPPPPSSTPPPPPPPPADEPQSTSTEASGGGASPAGGGNGGTVSPNRPLMLVLAYLGPLALIPLLVEQEDREVQWHAKQGLVLLGAEVLLAIALAIVTSILAAIPFLGCLAFLLPPLVGLGLLVLHVFLIYKAVGGERYRLPYVSDFAERF